VLCAVKELFRDACRYSLLYVGGGGWCLTGVIRCSLSSADAAAC
jgi:hypothetical protein